MWGWKMEFEKIRNWSIKIWIIDQQYNRLFEYIKSFISVKVHIEEGVLEIKVDDFNVDGTFTRLQSADKV